MTTVSDTSLVERLRFDAARCEVQFSKGVATNIEEAAETIERLTRELEQSQGSHERLFQKYQSALKDGAYNPPTREGIAAAINETNYKYFGDYELSESQWDAVHLLVNAARHLLTAEAQRDGAYEHAARICDQIRNNAERRAAEYKNGPARDSALDKMEGAIQCASAIRAAAKLKDGV